MGSVECSLLAAHAEMHPEQRCVACKFFLAQECSPAWATLRDGVCDQEEEQRQLQEAQELTEARQNLEEEQARLASQRAALHRDQQGLVADQAQAEVQPLSLPAHPL